MMAAELQGSCAKIQVATKIRIQFFYPSIVGCSQEKENRQLERFHLTLEVSRKEACLMVGVSSRQSV
jgi:hypothetical protein